LDSDGEQIDGALPDAKIAARFQRSLKSVQRRDTEIAARFDHHVSTACIRSQQLGIPNPYWQSRCGRQRSFRPESDRIGKPQAGRDK
jgi:hypothetical protein